MKPYRSVFTLALLGLALGAQAADTCDAQAMEKKLAGAAKASFIKKCRTDGARSACDAQAGEKKLAGAAKASFVKKCVADTTSESSRSAAQGCETQAADKKLAGAAKASFVKKCIKDAEAGK